MALALWHPWARGQGQYTQIRSYATFVQLNAIVCDPSTGPVAFVNSGGTDAGLYQCTTSNTWTKLNTSATSGTVTSVALGSPTGFTVSGSPITTSGTFSFAMPSGWTTGDLLVGNGANSVTRLAIGANGNCLLSNGTTGTWGTCTGAPALPTATLQANNAGSFSAVSGSTVNFTTGGITLQPATSQDAVPLKIAPIVATPTANLLEVYSTNALSATVKEFALATGQNDIITGNRPTDTVTGGNQRMFNYLSMVGGYTPLTTLFYVDTAGNLIINGGISGNFHNLFLNERSDTAEPGRIRINGSGVTGVGGGTGIAPYINFNQTAPATTPYIGGVVYNSPFVAGQLCMLAVNPATGNPNACGTDKNITFVIPEFAGSAAVGNPPTAGDVPVFSTTGAQGVSQLLIQQGEQPTTGTNTAGMDTVLSSQPGTGNAVVTHVFIKSPLIPKASGTATQGTGTRWVPHQKPLSTTNTTATTLFNSPNVDNGSVSVIIHLSVHASDGSAKNCVTNGIWEITAESSSGVRPAPTITNVGTNSAICTAGVSNMTLAVTAGTGTLCVVSVTPTWDNVNITPTTVTGTVEIHNIGEQDINLL